MLENGLNSAIGANNAPILIRLISTSPESLVIIGGKIFLAILSGAPLLCGDAKFC